MNVDAAPEDEECLSNDGNGSKAQYERKAQELEDVQKRLDQQRWLNIDVEDHRVTPGRGRIVLLQTKIGFGLTIVVAFAIAGSAFAFAYAVILGEVGGVETLASTTPVERCAITSDRMRLPFLRLRGCTLPALLPLPRRDFLQELQSPRPTGQVVLVRL